MTNRKKWLLLVATMVGLLGCKKAVPQEAVLKSIQAPSKSGGPCELYTKFIQAEILYTEVTNDPLRLMPALKLGPAQLDEVKRNAARNLAVVLTTKLRKYEFTSQTCETPYESIGLTPGIVTMHMDSAGSLASELERVYRSSYLQGSEFATYGEIHEAHRQDAIAAAPKLLEIWATKKFAKCDEAKRLQYYLQGSDQVYYKDLGLTPDQVIKLMDLYHEVKYIN